MRCELLGGCSRTALVNRLWLGWTLLPFGLRCRFRINNCLFITLIQRNLRLLEMRLIILGMSLISTNNDIIRSLVDDYTGCWRIINKSCSFPYMEWLPCALCDLTGLGVDSFCFCCTGNFYLLANYGSRNESWFQPKNGWGIRWMTSLKKFVLGRVNIFQNLFKQFLFETKGAYGKQNFWKDV